MSTEKRARKKEHERDERKGRRAPTDWAHRQLTSRREIEREREENVPFSYLIGFMDQSMELD